MIKKLQPLLFAGIIIDGGIIGYDTNMKVEDGEQDT